MCDELKKKKRRERKRSVISYQSFRVQGRSQNCLKAHTVFCLLAFWVLRLWWAAISKVLRIIFDGLKTHRVNYLLILNLIFLLYSQLKLFRSQYELSDSITEILLLITLLNTPFLSSLLPSFFFLSVPSSSYLSHSTSHRASAHFHPAFHIIFMLFIYFGILGNFPCIY